MRVAIFPVVPVITVLVTATAACSPVAGLTCVAVQAVVPPALESSLAVQICCVEVSMIVPPAAIFVTGVNPKVRSPPATVPFNVVRSAVKSCGVKAVIPAPQPTAVAAVVSVLVLTAKVTAEAGLFATRVEENVTEAGLPASSFVPPANVTVATVVVVAVVQADAKAVPSLVHAVVGVAALVNTVALAVMVIVPPASTSVVGVNHTIIFPPATPCLILSGLWAPTFVTVPD